MLRIPEYWGLWARLLEAEIDNAWRRGDEDRWCSLSEARLYALEIARLCHEEQARRDEQHRSPR